MPNPNFILIDKFEDYEKLVNTTTLPNFITKINDDDFLDHERFVIKGWHILRIMDEEAQVTYYCSALKSNADYLLKPLAASAATWGFTQ